MKSLNEYLYESYMCNDGLITEALKIDALRDFTKWVGGISSEATKKLNKMRKDINRIDPKKKVIINYYRDILNDIISSNGYKLNLGDINASIAFSEIDNEDMKILASIIGLEATIKIMCELQGVNISVPQNATVPAKIAYIQDVYDGSKQSRVKLSKLCGLSENYIFRMYRKKHKNI